MSALFQVIGAIVIGLIAFEAATSGLKRLKGWVNKPVPEESGDPVAEEPEVIVAVPGPEEAPAKKKNKKAAEEAV